MTMRKWRTTGFDTMKKILNLLLVLMLMASVVSLALADEAGDDHDNDTNEGHYSHSGDNKTGDPDQNETNDDNENETGDHDDGNQTNDDDENETEHEVEIMNDTLGAEIRLLQLEKAILKNLIKGEMTVAVLKGIEVNTTGLEAILAQLRDVLVEVRAADPAANNSVQVFVDLKNQSRNLTKQFRDALKELVNGQTLHDLREQLINITSSDLENCSQKIRHRIRQFNRNQIYRLYGLVGEVNLTALSEYLNGNVTLDQLTHHLNKLINQMTKEKRYEIFSEVKEENIKKKIQAHSSIDEIEHHGKGNGHGNKH
jgi:hypothetical protein